MMGVLFVVLGTLAWLQIDFWMIRIANDGTRTALPEVNVEIEQEPWYCVLVFVQEGEVLLARDAG